jgi:N-acetylglucosaminyldiphosphoundecaprenol N-acetyl-beta-D-mannosaminyltransferase
MPIVAVIAGLVAIVWGAIYARRGSLVVGCSLVLIAAYVVGHEFWHTKVGPVPVTLDRLALCGLLAGVAVQWRLGRLQLQRLVGCDWLLIGLVTLFAASALVSGPAEIAREGSSAWGRLLASYLLPALLYFIVRQAPVTRREWIGLLACFVALGVYLSFTAVCEIAGKWALVFPRYIADPNLGIHFGRARGPGLNAASLGIYLTACLWCGWVLLGQTGRRGLQLVLLAVLPLMALGVFFTYTRSTWIGLAASGLVVGWLQMPRRWRMPALVSASFAGLVLIAVSWSSLIGLKREGTAAEAEHSINQRESFAYVSWQMFKDHPLLGVGFGRFYDQKLPYLSDRRQEVELESIRSLDHHNTFLGVLTESGLIGLAMFCAVLVAWTRHAWLLAKRVAGPEWARAQGVLMLAIVVNYLCSAMFHDLTLVPAQEWLLFVLAGLTVNLRQGTVPFSCENVAHDERMTNKKRGLSPWVAGDFESANTLSARGTVPFFRVAMFEVLSVGGGKKGQSPETVPLFGMQVARVTMGETLERVLGWCGGPRGDACRFVVTPNVDHAVMFQERPELRAAYADAALVLADGAPIVLASRLIGRGLPERVAGSDLVPRLFAESRQPLRVFLLGAAAGVADEAAANVRRRWRNIAVVGTYSPPSGFENDDAENARILAMVAAAAPDLLIVGFGAPKQELWVHRHRGQLQAKVALCAGATIDFLAGHRRRSPVWMRRFGLEWVHRLVTEPRRLAGRYARDAWVFPQLVWREWRGLSS